MAWAATASFAPDDGEIPEGVNKLTMTECRARIHTCTASSFRAIAVFLWDSNFGQGRVSRPGLILMSLLSTLIITGCGSTIYSQVAATQNPLVAQYNVISSGAPQAWVEFGPTASYGRQTSWVSGTGKPGAALQILVAGMKASTQYHMRAHVVWPDGSTWVDQDHTFTTGALPSTLTPPGISMMEPTPGLSPAPGVELLCLFAPPGFSMLSSLVTDLQGNIIWYYPHATLPIKLLPNGRFIANLATDLAEFDLSGVIIRDVSLTQVNESLRSIGRSFAIINFSHDVLVLPNGHWITIGQVARDYTDLPGYPGTVTVLGDVVVDIDPSENVVWAWSAFDYLDVNRHIFGLPDWTHSNALIYTADGNLLLSMRSQSWILKLDYANGTGSGNILWKLGEDGDFTLTGGDPSQWFYGQHYPNILSVNGTQSTMAVYDDGNFRVDANGVACGSSPSAPACYSRAAIFQVDESTDVATLLWQDLPGFFSFWGGSIGTLSNGNIEFANSAPNVGPATSSIMEVTPTQNPQTVWQMNINGENAYRGYRIPSLYPGITWNQ
jgi:arylsulfate sulfotransferase